eukprot:9858882-Alexandrium_andersonii.AAC.1
MDFDERRKWIDIVEHAPFTEVPGTDLAPKQIKSRSSERFRHMQELGTPVITPSILQDAAAKATQSRAMGVGEVLAELWKSLPLQVKYELTD